MTPSRNKKGRFLPKKFDSAHELCFLIHDVMVEIIKEGEPGGWFKEKVRLEEHERNEIPEHEDIGAVFKWLNDSGRLQDKARILRSTVFPALLADMMHCYFEALESSRKGKLVISYMLIRKPLQESLYVLEAMVLDELDFSSKLSENPLGLRSQNAGGFDGHEKRIEKTIKKLGLESRFIAAYIAKLRYCKAEVDSFDGICNTALHLFTEHKAIKTEKMNVNFIFSDVSARQSQWKYLYSRLPYLLFYTLSIVEYLMEGMAPTTQDYLNDIQRRLFASVLLWWEDVDEEYRSGELKIFIYDVEQWLSSHCEELEAPIVFHEDLERMAERGLLPGESVFSKKIFNLRLSLCGVKSRVLFWRNRVKE